MEGPVGGLPQGCIRRGGTSETPPELDRRLEEVAEAVGGGYCRLQMPWKLALGVRETVAGHRLPSNASLAYPPRVSEGKGHVQRGPCNVLGVPHAT